MKTLIAIGTIQLVAIFWLYAKIADFDDRLAHAAATTQAPTLAHITKPAAMSDMPAGTATVIDEDRLRRIIREELVVQLGNQPSSPPTAAHSAAVTSADPVEMEARRKQLSQQLEYYVSVGSISDAEMQRLQIDIARLDAAGRTEMLRELTRALNSGRLEGQL